MKSDRPILFMSMYTTSDLIISTEKGLYCPAGDFYIDPVRPVETALITHAHSDHLRSGHRRYICPLPGESLIRHRLPKTNQTWKLEAVPYRIPFELKDVRISFHPAGHILGSAQIRIDDGRQVWVVSGDYKRSPDPTCPPFEVVPCDVFITESTFALPIYTWQPGTVIARHILSWWQNNPDKTSILFCYALGKTQRILAELGKLVDQPVWIHESFAPLVALYREAGISMLPTRIVDESAVQSDFKGALVLAPPSVHRTAWMKQFYNYETAFASGWMITRKMQQRRGYDRGFVISDHADWSELLQTIRETGASRVAPIHGSTTTLFRYLAESGINAFLLRVASNEGYQ